MINRLLRLFVIAPIAMLAASCGDSCGDVACLPSPPPLEVIVYDTATVPTSIRRLEGTDSVTIDTTMVRKVATTDAVVTIVTGVDSLYTTVDTLKRVDTIHAEFDLARIPTGFFRIRSQRLGRQFVSDLRKIEHVTGCCPYSIVGRFTFTLP